MRVCAISFKSVGMMKLGIGIHLVVSLFRWPAIGSLFDEMTLIITESRPQPGGILLPAHANIVPLMRPVGEDFRRKLSVFYNLSHYLPIMFRHIRQSDVVGSLPGRYFLVGHACSTSIAQEVDCAIWWLLVFNQPDYFDEPFNALNYEAFCWRTQCNACYRRLHEFPAPNIHWIFVTAISRAELAQVPPLVDHGLSSPPRLAYIGRLSPEKGVHVLVRAVSLLQSEGFQPMPVITLIGDGPRRIELENMIRDLGVTFFIFMGQFDRQDLSSALCQADMCVLPSLIESYGKAILEALMYGLPIITTDVGSAHSILGVDGERGWIVPPDNFHELASILRRVLSEPMDSASVA